MNTIKNPYIGPRTFQRDEGHLFFGREREARDLISLVASERLVVFYAQSGAGKSSIVNTRLIPNLEEKEYEVLPVGRVSGDSGEGLEVHNIYIYNLLRSLEQHDVEPVTVTKLTLTQFLCQLNYDDKGFFYDPTLPESMPAEEDETIVRRALIIDQFEELLSTHPEAWEKREDFFAQLAQAMQDDPHLWVVLVMREDYIAALDPYAHLVMNGLRLRYYMQRLGREAALKAVKSPVEGLRPYADNVAEKLINDLCSIKVQQVDGRLEIQPGQYVEPVQLQVVCYGLWENLPPQGTQITEKDLQEVGDVDQSLGRYYDRRVGEVAKAKNVRERLIREWFEKKLITTGGIRNMVLQERDSNPDELADHVIQALQSDLVRAEKRSGGTWYELTHDRLVEPILERNKVWFNENLSPLQRQATLWEDQDHNESWLLRDQGLQEVEEWAREHQDELTETEIEFLDACRKSQTQIDDRHAAERLQLEMANKLAEEQARATRRARVFNIISVVLVLIAAIATYFAVNSAQQAKISATNAKELQKIAEDQAKIARARELSTIALDRASSEIDLAILLGLQAQSIYNDTHTQSTLFALQQKAGRFKDSWPHGEDILSLQYSPNGQTLASLEEAGINLWNADTHEQLNDEPINGHFSSVTALAISPDEEIMASGASNGSVVIWDTEKQAPLCSPFEAHIGAISSLAFNKDGQLLASASSSENIIHVWDLSNVCNVRKLTSLEGHTQPVLTVVFHPNQDLVASGGFDYTIRLWDPRGTEQLVDSLDGQFSVINDLVFNSDGNMLASAGNNNRVSLWQVGDQNTAQPLGEILHESYVSVQRIAISPDDSILASGNDDRSITLWNIEDPAKPQKLGNPIYRNGYNPTNLTFLSDRNTLVATDSNGAVGIWNVKDPEEPEKISELTPPQAFRLYGTGTTEAIFIKKLESLIVGSGNSSLLYWDISDTKHPQTTSRALQGHPGRPSSMSFSKDSNLLVSSGEDGNFLIDMETQRPLGTGYLYENAGSEFLVYQIFEPESERNYLHIRNSRTGESIGEPMEGQDPSFSPDGKKIIFQTSVEGSQFPAFHLFGIENRKKIDLPLTDRSPVFSGTSKILAYQASEANSSNTTLTLWDIDDSSRLLELPGATFLAFSSDGQFLAYQTYTTTQSIIHVFDIASSKDVVPGVQGSYTAISRDGKALWYQTYKPETGESWINFLKIGATAEPQSFSSNTTAVSQDANLLAFLSMPAGPSSSIHLLDLTLGEELISPVAGYGIDGFYANGKVLVIRSSDSVQMLNTVTGEILFRGASNSYLTPLATESSEIIAFQSYDYTTAVNSILLINTTTGQRIGEILKGNFLTMDPAGKFLAYQAIATEGNGITLVDLSTNSRIGEPIAGTYMDIDWAGKTLITKSESDSISFWDVTKTWPFGNPVEGSPESVSTARLSPTGSLLAWVGENGITLQNTQDATLMGVPFKNHLANIGQVSTSISPDGRVLAITRLTDNGGITTLIEISTGRQIGEPILDSTFTAFSPDGSLFVASSLEDETTTLWDLHDLAQIKKLNVDPIPGYLPAFSPDGKTIVIAKSNPDPQISIWDVNSNKIISDSIAGEYATFSPDGKMIAVFDSNTGNIVLWKNHTFEQTDISIPGGFMCFSPDGQVLAVAGLDNGITFWDANTGESLNTAISASDAFAFPVRFSQDGRYLILIRQDSASISTTVWDLRLDKQVGETMELAVDSSSFNLPPISFAGSSPDDKIYAFLDEENTVSLWNRETDTTQEGPTYPGELLGINLNQRGPFFLQNNTSNPGVNILVMYGDRGLLLWDLDKDRAIGDLLPLSQDFIPATSVVISPDNNIVASFAEDGIVLRDLNNSTDTRLEDSKQFFSNMVFSADSRHLMALGESQSLLSWDVETGQLITEELQLPEDLFTATSAMFSPLGNLLAFEKGNSTGALLQVWNTAKRESYLVVPISLDNPGGRIAFSHDESLMAFSDGARVIVFDLRTNEFAGEILTGPNGISNLSLIMKNGELRYLVTADTTATTQLWDWPTRTRIGGPISGNLQISGIDEQNQRVYYIDSSGKLIQMDLDLTHLEWVEQLCPLAQRNFSQAEWKLYFPAEEYPAEELTCPDFPAGK